ncbi:MAG: MaoC family dehydratase [Thermoplasmataceae archaeon]
MSIREIGQTGIFFEDLSEGQVISHPRGRTLIDADCVWLSLITGDQNQIHYNLKYSQENFANEPFNGRLVVNGLYVLMIVNSLTGPETSTNGIFLGIDKLRLMSPCFSGDTLTAKSTVIEKRLSEKHATMGVVRISVEGYKLDGTRVITYEKSFMTRLRGSKFR